MTEEKTYYSTQTCADSAPSVQIMGGSPLLMFISCLQLLLVNETVKELTMFSCGCCRFFPSVAAAAAEAP